MSRTVTQMSLFQSGSLNPTYEIKRQLRVALSGSTPSRKEIVDEINKIAIQEGMRKQISKETLDNWTKDSDPDRLPSLPWLTILCKVLDTVSPIAAIIQPLGGKVIGPKEAKLLIWAEAKMEKKHATKKERLAEQALEVFLNER